jgi:mRNA interferase MazF
LIVQANGLLPFNTVIVAATSTSAAAASFRPEIAVAGTRTRVLVDRLGAVDLGRLGRYADRLGAHELGDLDAALALGL